MTTEHKARYEEFARRLGAAMHAANMTTTDLHRALGVTYEMARRYTLGLAMPRGSKFSKLATILGCNESFLHGIEDSGAVDGMARPVPTGRRIPVRTSDQIISKDFSNITEMISVPAGDYSPDAWAYALQSDCMEGVEGRYIEQGALLIVDPERIPRHNSVVIANINDDIVVGHYVRYGGVISIRPSNPRYPSLNIDPTGNIEGVVVRALFTFE